MASFDTPGGHRRLARRVLTATGRQHLAHDHFVDILAGNLRPCQGLADCDGAQILGGDGGKGSIEGADRGPGRAGDDNIGGLGHG